jgi:hypothetical protein
MRGLNAQGILGVFAARDYGVMADGQVDDAAAIQRTIYAASILGGGQVWLPSDASAVAIGSTILLPDDVELVIPAGCTLQLLPGANCDLIANADSVGGNSRIRISGAGVIDGNRLNQGAGNWHGVHLVNVSDPRIEGVQVKSCQGLGILLTGCTRPNVDAEGFDNGIDGLGLVDTIRGTIRGPFYDNCKVAAPGTGDGIHLDGASTDNVIISPVCYDSAAPADRRQGYGVREDAASTCDRNLVVGGSLDGNLTGTVSLIGASSKLIDLAAVIEQAALPSPLVFGGAGSPGASGKAADQAHVHPMPAAPTPADGSIANIKLGPDVARANLLTNGGMEVDQRGGTVTASGAYAHDRWLLTLGGTSTISVTDETTLVDTGSGHAMKAIYTHGTAVSTISQKLEGLAELKGRVLSLGIRVKVATANAVRPWISTDGGTTKTYGSYHTGGDTYEALKVENVAVAAGATSVMVGLELAASTTVYVDNAMLVIGSVACDYQWVHPHDDMDRCQRYYEVHGGVADGSVAYYGNAPGNNVQGFGRSFAVRKAVIPTMTKGGTWTVSNCGQPTAGGASVDGYFLSAGGTAAGNMVFSPNSADDTIIAEANP